MVRRHRVVRVHLPRVSPAGCIGPAGVPHCSCHSPRVRARRLSRKGFDFTCIHVYINYVATCELSQQPPAPVLCLLITLCCTVLPLSVCLPVCLSVSVSVSLHSLHSPPRSPHSTHATHSTHPTHSTHSTHSNHSTQVIQSTHSTHSLTHLIRLTQVIHLSHLSHLTHLTPLIPLTPLTPSLTHLTHPIHSLTHSPFPLTHSPTQSLIHPLTHSLTGREGTGVLLVFQGQCMVVLQWLLPPFPPTPRPLFGGRGGEPKCGGALLRPPVVVSILF